MREGRQHRVRPVFFDRSGRRRRFAVLLGTGLATALLTGLGALAVALSGSTGVDVPGFPDSDRRADAPDDPLATTEPRTTPGLGGPPGQAGTDPASVVATPTVTPSSERPGNGRNPSRTPHPKPTKNR